MVMWLAISVLALMVLGMLVFSRVGFWHEGGDL